MRRGRGQQQVPHLQPYLQPSAAIAKHVSEVWAQAVVGSRLNGQADALGAGLLAVLDGLSHTAGGVACRSQVTHTGNTHEAVRA